MYQRKLKIAANRSVREHYNNQISESANIQKESWKVIDSLMACENQNGLENISLMVQGEPCTDPREVAEIVNNHYLGVPAEVCKHLENVKFNLETIKKVDAALFLSPCTEDHIRRIVTKMKNKKSSGLDEISNLVIKQWWKK